MAIILRNGRNYKAANNISQNDKNGVVNIFLILRKKVGMMRWKTLENTRKEKKR